MEHYVGTASAWHLYRLNPISTGVVERNSRAKSLQRRLLAPPAVVDHRLPSALANWMAANPVPPAPP